jgi:methylenetetrahydrofolate reductase (NADPH)
LGTTSPRTSRPAWSATATTSTSRKLLEISMRIGVGPSVSFVRKQRGIRRLLTRSSTPADHLYHVLAPTLHDPGLNVEGFHFYTFNQLVATWRWAHDRRHRAVLASEGPRRSY